MCIYLIIVYKPSFHIAREFLKNDISQFFFNFLYWLDRKQKIIPDFKGNQVPLYSTNLI